MTVSQSTFLGGAAADHALAADRTLTRGSKRVQVLLPTVGGLSVVLPSATLLRTGGPRFVILNLSPTHSLTVKDAGGAVLVTLAVSKGAVLSLAKNDTAAGVWSFRVSSVL